MGNLNKVLLIGRLGQDPEKRVTPQGASVVTLSLATSEKYKDRSGNLQEKTEWHRVVFWNQQAETIEKYCKKGSQLYIEGRLQTKEWQDKDGGKRWSTEINGSSFQFLDSPNQSREGGNPNNPQQGYQNNSGGFQQGSGGNQTSSGGDFQNAPNSQDSNNEPPPDDFVEDDIPF